MLHAKGVVLIGLSAGLQSVLATRACRVRLYLFYVTQRGLSHCIVCTGCHDCSCVALLKQTVDV